MAADACPKTKAGYVRKGSVGTASRDAQELGVRFVVQLHVLALQLQELAVQLQILALWFPQVAELLPIVHSPLRWLLVLREPRLGRLDSAARAAQVRRVRFLVQCEPRPTRFLQQPHPQQPGGAQG